jgi:hypothetical protein
MSIIWLRPFMDLTQNDFRILAKKYITVVNKTWKNDVF